MEGRINLRIESFPRIWGPHYGILLCQQSPVQISDTILFKLDVNVLKNLNCPTLNHSFRAEVIAEVEKIPKFSTFTRCNAA